jgi:hypothetical protein
MLDILNVSLSTSQPQCKLKEPSQIWYIEYELELLPSLPRFNLLTKSAPGTGYGDVEDRSNLASKAHEQHGIEKHPEASCIVESTGTLGVISSVWFPKMKMPGWKETDLLPMSLSEVGSRACDGVHEDALA